MAVQSTGGLTPDPRCPTCGGRIDTKPFSRTALFGTLVFGDLAVYALAGVFVLFGLMWEPAWIIALVIVVFAIVRRSSNQTHFICAQCQREFKYSELYESKN